KDSRIAGSRRASAGPSLSQIQHVIRTMPDGTEIERRDRAIVAFILLTGARDSAVTTIRLKHIDLVAGSVYQDAREVKTKFSKTFTTYFFPVGEDIRKIVVEWITHLRDEKMWSGDDPLFPATEVRQGRNRLFEVVGLSRACWGNAGPIRQIFKR